MPPFLTILQYVVPLVFLLILIDCWRTPNLLPLFGSTRTARIAWTLAILTANPVLLVGYVLVARKQWWSFEREQRRDRILLACICMGVLLQIPFGQANYEKVIHKNGESFSHWGLSVGGNNASTSTNSSTSTSRGAAPLEVRKIRVTASRDPLSWAIGEKVAELFSKEPWAESIELVPRGHVAQEEASLSPELFVDVHAGNCSHLPIPLYNKFTGPIRVTVSSAPHYVENSLPGNRALNRSPIETNANVKLDFTRVGLAWGSAYYGDPAKEVASKFESGPLAHIRELVQKYGMAGDFPAALVPQLPSLNYEPNTSIPSFLIGKSELVRILEAYSPFIHNRSSFQFEDDRRALTVLGELKESLVDVGWTNFYEEERPLERSYIKARKGGATLTASRWPLPQWRPMTSYMSGVDSDGEQFSEQFHQPEPPLSGDSELFVVTITYPFEGDELRSLATSLVSEATESPNATQVAELLILQKFLDDEGEEILRRGMREFPSPKGADWLTLAKLDIGADDLDAAAGAAEIARALFKLERNYSEETTVQKLIQEHNLQLPEREDGEEPYLNYELMAAAGFPSLGPDSKAASASIGPGEAARIVTKGREGEVVLWTLGVKQLEPEIQLTSVIMRAWSQSYTSGSLQNLTTATGNGLRFDLQGEVKQGRIQLEITIVE
jgi:hypothetical protein